MKTIFAIIKKNVLTLLRSKFSSLIIIFGPFLLIFLAGTAFDTMEKYSLKVGVFSESYSDISNSMIEKLKQSNFAVEKFKSKEDCINAIKREQIHACIVFPPNLQISQEKENEITFYVDYSKLNLVWSVIDTISTKVTEKREELSTTLTEQLLKSLESIRQASTAIEKPSQATETYSTQAMTMLGDDIVYAKLSTLESIAKSIKNIVSEKLNTITSSAQSIKSDIKDQANMSDETKSEIYDELDDITESATAIRERIEDPENKQTYDIPGLLNKLSELESDINQVKSLLQAQSSNIESVKSNLDKIKKALNEVTITKATTIITPFKTKINPIIPERTYLTYLFPSLVILVVMFISLLLSTTLVMIEKHSPAFFRNFITPTPSIIFLLGTYLTNILLVFVQIAIILSVAALLFKASFPTVLPSILILFFTTTTFTFIGMLIGYLFKSEETATLATISLGSAFLFLSNAIIPIESLPSILSKFSFYNPFVIAESALRQTILFGMSIKTLMHDMIPLFVYMAILFAILLLLHTIARKKISIKHLIHGLRHK
ncbi:hypothetical protein DRZ77_02805 [Candidatus Woesearchaeota archaeon]|nr:ABC transporter permease [Candidatus Woesearchaeota archaeon]RLE40211.1 MAG: hypothetical protein DRZ77_02805 [Candidatus Woesearchaeota archaeon]